MARTPYLIIVFLMTILSGVPSFGAPITITGIDSDTTYTFDGTFLTPLNDNDLDRSLTQRSTAVWFNTEDLLAPQMIYEEGGRTNGLNIHIANGEVIVGAWAGADGSWLGTPTTANAWHHVAYIYDQNRFTLYYDGVAIDTIGTPFDQIPAHSGANALGGINGWSMIADGNAGQVDDHYYFSGMISGLVFDDEARDANWVDNWRTQTMPVPLPASLFLLAGGLFTLFGLRRFHETR